MTDCYCGSGAAFETCCEPLLKGAPAPTALSLMRSRYTAYVRGEVDYLEVTCCEEERRSFNRQEAEHIVADTKWRGLEIISTKDGSAGDERGEVEFVFRFETGGKPYAQYERASFCREGGAWRYEKSDMTPNTEPERVAQVGRNDPCPCGSGAKYKKCCGA